MNNRRLTVLVAASLLLVSCSRDPLAVEHRALDRGKRFLAKADYARALLELKNAMQATPQDGEPYYQAGLVAMAEHDPEAAFAYFNRAVELNPNHTDARLKVAQLMASSSDLATVAEAEKQLTELLSSSPSNLDLLGALALAEDQLHKPAEAAHYLEQALAQSPGHFASSILLANIKLSQNDSAGAEQVLTQAVEHEPASAAPRLALAGLYLRLNRTAEAEAQIRRALDLDPRNAPALLGLATIQSQTGRTAKAEETYRRLSALPDRQYKSAHAAFLLRTGNTLAAIPELENLAKTDDSRESRSLLVTAYTITGEIDRARDVLSSALRSNPKDVDALLQKSQLDLKVGEPSSAVEAELHQVLLFQPDSAEAHFLLSKVYALLGSAALRRQELEEALRLSPGLAAARIELAQDLLTERQPEAALEALIQAPPGQQELTSIVVSRILVMQSAGDAAGARKELDRRLAAARLPDLVFLDGVLRFETLDYAGAQLNAEEVLRKNPVDTRALRLLVDACAARNQLADAETALRAAAAQQPKSAVVKFLIGDLLMKRGDNSGARAALVAARSDDPQFTEAALKLADLDLSEGKIQSARETLSAFVLLNPGNSAAFLRLAALEDRSGNPSGTIDYLRKVVDLDSRNALALNNLAFLLTKSDPDGALGYAERAEQLSPQNPAVEDTLGWIYYRKRMFRQAINHLKVAVAEGPTPQRQFHLGMAYTQSGDQATGRTIVAGAIKADPTLVNDRTVW